MSLDKRIYAFRSDLASEELFEKVNVPHYAKGTKKSVTASLIQLRREPSLSGAIDSEVLMGDCFTVFDESGDWAWGQLGSDQYVGYIPSEALGEWNGTPTHRVNVLRTFFFNEPNMKLPPHGYASMNAGIHVTRFEGDFARTSKGFCIFSGHLTPWNEPLASDFVSIAEKFVGTPYLWGGKSSLGIDCSGLIQTSLAAIGVPAPRDSDMQEIQLGTPVEIKKDLSGLQRGDLVFWKGHVGVMSSPTILLHATAYNMLTFKEPLAEAASRIIQRMNSPITSIKRFA